MRYLCGLGNYLKNDDGIGLHIVEYIVEHGLENDFVAIEIGSDSLKLLNYFTAETEKIVIVDCALLDKQPGDYAIFAPDDAVSRKELTHLTSHESDIMQTLQLAQKLDYPIPDLTVLAIQPDNLALEMNLSPLLKKKLPHYVNLAIAELAKN